MFQALSTHLQQDTIVYMPVSAQLAVHRQASMNSRRE